MGLTPFYAFYGCIGSSPKRAISVDHAIALAAPKSGPIFLRVQEGLSVVITDTDGNWRMADVIQAIGSADTSKVPFFLQVTYVDTGIITWVNADLVTHIVPRV